MIAFMRKIAHSTLYRFFLWSFLLMMAFGGGVAIFTSKEKKDWIIKIYQKSINVEQYLNIKSRLKQQQQMYKQQGLLTKAFDLDKQALQASVAALLSEHAADTIGMDVAESQIEQYMHQKLQQIAPQFIDAQGKVNMQALQAALGMNNIDDFASEIEQELKNSVVFGLIDAAIYVPHFQTVLAYKAEFADKKYSYLSFPLSKYLAKVQEKAVSEDALNQFYRQPEIADQFRIAEKRAGTLWVFDAQGFDVKPTASEIKAFYDKHKASRYVVQSATMQIRSLLIKFKNDEAKARETIQELHQTAMQDPEKFEKLVRQFSQDAKGMQNGGLSEFFSKDDKKMDAAVVQTAFEHLHQDGQLSVPLKTARGFEIIQRVSKKNPIYKDLKIVEPEIRQEFIVEKFKKRFAQDAARVVTNAKYSPDTLKNFIARYHGVESKIALNEKTSSVESGHLFRIEQGRYTSFVHKDRGYILLCTQVEKSKLPALEQVKSKVLALYHKQQAQKAMNADLRQAYQDASTMSFAGIAQKYGSTLQSAAFTYKNGEIDQSAILKDQQIAMKVRNLPCVGAVFSAATDNNGVLMYVEQVALINEPLFYAQKEALNQVLYYTQMYQYKDAFIASLYRTAKINNKIEIKKEFLQNIKEV